MLVQGEFPSQFGRIRISCSAVTVLQTDLLTHRNLTLVRPVSRWRQLSYVTGRPGSRGSKGSRGNHFACLLAFPHSTTSIRPQMPHSRRFLKVAKRVLQSRERTLCGHFIFQFLFYIHKWSLVRDK